MRVQPGRKRGPLIEVRFSAPPGITALFGASGVGKTTALLAIAGLIEPSSGRIALGGTPLFDMAAAIDVRPEARRVALVFQSLALFPHMSAIDNVAYALPRALPRGE